MHAWQVGRIKVSRLILPILCLALIALSYVWYRRLFDPDRLLCASPKQGFALGLPPVVAVIVLSAFVREVRFLLVAILGITILAAMATAPFPDSIDVGFQIGKVLWAMRGEWTLDPGIGVVSVYPPAFHVIWARVATALIAEPREVLRYAAIANLVGLWGALWWYGRRTKAGPGILSIPWIAALVLFRKESGAYFEVCPWALSIPFALTGWQLWVTAHRRFDFLMSGVLLIAAIIIWPVHIFPAVCVCLIYLSTHWRRASFWVLSSCILFGICVTWYLRQLVPGGEWLAGMQLIPKDVPERLQFIMIYVPTMGTTDNGAMVGIASAALTAVFLMLSWFGWRSERSTPLNRDLIRVVSGLGLGTIFASWTLFQPAFGGRLAFLTALVALPLTLRGFEMLSTRVQPRWLGSRALWVVCLGTVWLAPILANGVLTTSRQLQWNERNKPVVDVLASRSKPGQRVWANPDAYRALILGKLPLFGFLAHESPRYYSAPREVADSLARKHEYIAKHGPVNLVADLRDAGVDWVILEKGADSSLPLTQALSESLPADLSDASHALYRIPPGP